MKSCLDVHLTTWTGFFYHKILTECRLCLAGPVVVNVKSGCVCVRAVPNITVTKARPTTVVTTTFLPSTAVTTQPTTASPKTTTQSSKALPHVGRLPCPTQTVRDIHWPETSVGETVTMACPNNHDGRWHSIESLWKIFCRLWMFRCIATPGVVSLYSDCVASGEGSVDMRRWWSLGGQA